MNTMKLCTCLNCGNVYIDMNPSNGSEEYSTGLIELFKIQELPTIELDDGDIGYGCPECGTDGNLQDNVNGFAGGIAEQIHVYLHE